MKSPPTSPPCCARRCAARCTAGRCPWPSPSPCCSPCAPAAALTGRRRSSTGSASRGCWRPAGCTTPPASRRRERRFLRRLDHSMILVGISGTYTAVIVLALSGTTEVVLLTIAWSLAIIGVTIRMRWLDAPSGLVAAVYLVAGWQMLIDLPAYEAAITAGELSLLAVGGGLYTVGAVIYAAQASEPVAGRVRLPRGLPHPGGGRGVVPLGRRLVDRGVVEPCSSARRPGPVWPTGRSRWRSAGSGGRPCAPAAR